MLPPLMVKITWRTQVICSVQDRKCYFELNLKSVSQIQVFQKLLQASAHYFSLRAMGLQESGNCREKSKIEVHMPKGLKAQVVCDIGALYEASGQYDFQQKVSPYQQRYSLLHFIAGKPGCLSYLITQVRPDRQTKFYPTCTTLIHFKSFIT